MIIGIVPVGGVGARLGMPFAKELIPLKGYDYYYPVIELTVSNMESAGADQIIFVHGKEYKQAIVDRYKEDCYVHLLNEGNSVDVFRVAYNYIGLKEDDDDVIIYGLPDSVYEGNPFIELLKHKSFVVGMFNVNDSANVGRINCDITGDVLFIKSTKTNYNNDSKCWGVFKIDNNELYDFSQLAHDESSIENIFSYFCETVINFDSYYIDLGTYEGLNEYWSNF